MPHAAPTLAPRPHTLPGRARNHLTRLDLLCMLAGLLYAMVITAVLAHGRIFWEDEMLGWMILRDPSWHHALLAYNTGADGGGFSFYLLGRAWFHLFGPSPLSFRLLSAACFGLAFAATWAALRRFYSLGIVAFATLNTWFFSPPFVAHMAEGRFYGLLVLGVSLVIWLTVLLADLPTPTPRRFYVLMFLAHGLLTISHLLGAAFGAALLLALVALDLLAHRLRPLLYIAGAAAWLLLLAERANILASAAVGKPHFWTTAPTAHELLDVYTGSSKEIAAVLAFLLCAAAILLARGPGITQALRQAWSTRRPAFAVVVAMLLVPVAFLLEGLAGGTWLFNDRYLLPITVAVAWLTAELSQLALAYLPRTPDRILRPAAAIVFAAAMLFWDLHHLKNFSPSPQDYTAQLTRQLPRGIPVVCEDAFCFTELIGRQHDSGVRYMYLLDWQQSLNPAAPRLEVTQYHLMQNWRRVGYFSGSIEPIDEFLAHNRRFLVIHTGPAVPNHLPPTIGNPLAARFARNPAFQVLPYTSLTYGKFRDTVWLVCRGSCAGNTP